MVFNLIDILPEGNMSQASEPQMSEIRTRSWAEAISHRLTGRGPLWGLEEEAAQSSACTTTTTSSCHEDEDEDTVEA